MMKPCTKCKITKDYDEFYTAKTNKSGKASWCKQCTSKAAIEFGNKHPNSPETNRAARLKYKYGITVKEYENLLEKQKGCCSICKKHFSEFKVRLDQDHSHEFGFNRGLLCRKCNILIDRANENIDVLKSAIEYLQEWEM